MASYRLCSCVYGFEPDKDNHEYTIPWSKDLYALGKGNKVEAVVVLESEFKNDYGEVTKALLVQIYESDTPKGADVRSCISAWDLFDQDVCQPCPHCKLHTGTPSAIKDYVRQVCDMTPCVIGFGPVRINDKNVVTVDLQLSSTLQRMREAYKETPTSRPTVAGTRQTESTHKSVSQITQVLQNLDIPYHRHNARPCTDIEDGLLSDRVRLFQLLQLKGICEARDGHADAALSALHGLAKEVRDAMTGNVCSNAVYEVPAWQAPVEKTNMCMAFAARSGWI